MLLNLLYIHICAYMCIYVYEYIHTHTYTHIYQGYILWQRCLSDIYINLRVKPRNKSQDFLPFTFAFFLCGLLTLKYNVHLCRPCRLVNLLHNMNVDVVKCGSLVDTCLCECSQAILLRKTFWFPDGNRTRNFLIAGEMLSLLRYMESDGEWRLHLCTGSYWW